MAQRAAKEMKIQGPNRSPSTNASVGLRSVAIFEAAKGGIVLLLTGGVLDLIHKNLGDVAERLAEALHVNPEGKLTNVFGMLASHAREGTLWVLALGAVVYAAVRSIEAYGLWREREWAQWFALLSTALYLPPELYWLLRRPGWLSGSVFATNVLNLLFMLTLRVNAARRTSPPH